MADREKVITALENGIATAEAIEAIAGGFVYITMGVARDALELLKQQEPVEPWIHIDITPDGDSMVINCGACHAELARVQEGVPFNDVQKNVKYCIRCGKAVKWDGAD